MPPAQPALTVEQLRTQIGDGDIDTVVVAFPDMQGRLQGKRIHAQFFLDTVLEHGTEGCNYLLAVDVDMNTVDGYAISSWERGYGDMEFVLDLDTLHPVPWLPGTAMVICDLAWLDDEHTPVAESPRQILRAQAERAAEKGLVALAGTELEFIVFNDTYEQAWDAGYRDLTPANQYNVDYSLLGTSRVEPLLRDIRNDMYGAGLVVESAKGECNLGQHEIAFKYDEVVRTADNHSIYKNGAKEIASQHGKALTFMAKFDEREGNSCHIHMSLRGDRRPASSSTRATARRRCSSSFVAGIQATMCEFTLLYAPNINSYKRFQAGQLRPDVHRVGLRQPHLLAARGRPRRRAAAGEPAARRRREPVPRAGRHAGRAGCAASSRSSSWSRRSPGNAYDVRPPEGPDVAAGRARPVRRVRDGPRGLRRRGRRPLRQQRRRRADRVRLRGHRLGALPLVREDVTVAEAPLRTHEVIDPATEEHVTTVTLDLGRGDRRGHRPGARRVRAVAAGRPGRPGPAAAAVRRRGRRRRRGARGPGGAQLRAHHLQRPLGGRATSATCSTTTPPPRSGCSAGRSRSPAGWTSPSRSRSASSP